MRDGEVLVVHRPRYDDWSLPKGHVDDGESWSQTALREVEEETGVSATITGEAFPISYVLGDGTPKIVVFLPMRPGDDVAEELTGDPDEVDQVAWWPIERAVSELSYPDERRVCATLSGSGSESAGRRRG
jgi:8-oxo-dGTP pyrophosphatase MutT (NUDIX family)